jgi:glycerol kinase
MTHAVLALDQGSHASRACLFDAAGLLRAAATVDVATLHPQPDHVEHDPAELLASLHTAIQRCMKDAPDLHVEAVGLATQRSSLLCCHRQSLTPLSTVLSWQDRRNAAWLHTLDAYEPRVRDITGLPLSPHYGASKMRWCLDHLSAVAAARRADQLCFAPLASWLAAELGGLALKADPANASRTLLFDSASLDWSAELLQLFDVRPDELPAIAATDSGFGAMLIGRQTVPLCAVTGDQSAVPFAFGAPEEDTVYVNLGTGAFIQRPLLRRPSQVAPLLGSVLAEAAGRRLYSLEGTVNGAGSAISWLVATRQLDQAALWSALETLDAEAPLPIFCNGIGGLGSPWWRAEQASSFEGDGDTLAHFAAVLESVVFMLASNFRLMSGSSPMRRLCISGGMSRSNWLCRRLAAVMGVPVSRMTTEATGRGIAALAAPALAADWPPADATRFDMHAVRGLHARQARFDALMAAAAPTLPVPGIR